MIIVLQHGLSDIHHRSLGIIRDAFDKGNEFVLIIFFTAFQLSANIIQYGILMLHISEDCTFVLSDRLLKLTYKLEVREESLLSIDVLSLMCHLILAISTHLHLMMRELESNLLIWTKSLVERKCRPAGLKVYEMERKLPLCHLFSKAVGIDIYTILDVCLEILQEVFLTGSYSYL